MAGMLRAVRARNKEHRIAGEPKLGVKTDRLSIKGQAPYYNLGYEDQRSLFSIGASVIPSTDIAITVIFEAATTERQRCTSAVNECAEFVGIQPPV